MLKKKIGTAFLININPNLGHPFYYQANHENGTSFFTINTKSKWHNVEHSNYTPLYYHIKTKSHWGIMFNHLNYTILYTIIIGKVWIII